MIIVQPDPFEYRILSTTVVECTRKPKKCAACKREISKGERAHYRYWKRLEERGHCYLHPICDQIWQTGALNSEGGLEDFYWVLGDWLLQHLSDWETYLCLDQIDEELGSYERGRK